MLTQRLTVAVLVPVTILACTTKKKDDNQLVSQLSQLAKQMGASNGASGNGTPKEGDPCSLLDPNDVAKAIGPLVAPPYHGTWRPERRSESCRYETAGDRRLLVTVTWSGGPMAMKMVRFARGLTDGILKQGQMKAGQVVLATGDTLVGSWDEIAEGAGACCDLNALRGDQLVELNWEGTRLTPAAAGALLSSAVDHLDHPLNIDGEAGIPAAEKIFDEYAKDSALDMCALVPQATVEQILGKKLKQPPAHGQGSNPQSSCTYLVEGGGMSTEYDLTLWNWHDGALQFADDQSAIGSGMRAIRVMTAGKVGADTAAAASDTTEFPVGPWDVAAPSVSPGYEAVRGPLLVKVGAMGDRKGALGLLAQAMTAINAANPIATTAAAPAPAVAR